jgi:hypothetical protein
LQIHATDIDGVWNVSSTSVRQVYYVDDDGVLPQVVFTLQLDRLPMYYMIKLMLPTFLLTILNVAMYWLPLESGERISFGVTLILSHFVNLGLIDNYVPVSSTEQALLGKFYSQ